MYRSMGHLSMRKADQAVGYFNSQHDRVEADRAAPRGRRGVGLARGAPSDME
jgi:hypothetical protein